MEGGNPTDFGRVMLAVVLIIFLMVSVGAMYLMSAVMIGDDARAESHDYAVTGTCGGESVTGTAHSRYFNESNSDYIYAFSFDLSRDDPEMDIVIIMNGPDEAPAEIAGMDYDDLGTEIVGDKECHAWRVTDGGYTYVFRMDGDFLSRKTTVEGNGYSLTMIPAE